MQRCVRAVDGRFYDGSDEIRDGRRVKHYRSVRIPLGSTACYNPDPTAPLLATYVTPEGRRGYVYSRRHRARRDMEKFARLARLGRALPRIRSEINGMLASPRPEVRRQGTALALIDRCHFRPGSRDYVLANGTYGATVLRRWHLVGDTVRFLGKRRVANTCRLTPGLASILRGVLRPKDGLTCPRKLNAHLPEGLFLKDLRTWGANVEFVRAVRADPSVSTRWALARVAKLLTHTVKTCRRSYVIPYLTKNRAVVCDTRPLTVHGLSEPENVLLAILEDREGTSV